MKLKPALGTALRWIVGQVTPYLVKLRLEFGEVANVSEIPVPDESGVTGNQQLGPARIPAPAPNSLAPLSANTITTAVEGLAESLPKGLGGEVPARLMAGALSQFSHELGVAKDEIRNKDRQLAELNKELTAAKVSIASLSERIKSITGAQTLKQICIFFGGLLVSYSVDCFNKGLYGPGLVSGAAGSILVLFGWLSNRNGESR